MKPVMQKICNLQTGDCCRACVASIFELPLESVPNFMMGGNDHFQTYLNRWCDQFGIVAINARFEDDFLLDTLKDCYMIAIGKGQRDESWEKNDPEYKEKYKDFQHGVVWFNGKLVHDPYPGGTGLDGKPEFFMIFVIKDPSKRGELFK